ncbi:unnamed protein product [Clonostachys rosea f. rosea IK726]|uniref:Uncharacterized protein n=1 Tax=Clonostachys rosea f. rosea IK726 TaxID=1349383 RepID=A0ACA9UNU6_BIOOC|nr:unnamed protein product [Clonostachys rosea f. rosea IK726]
MTRKSFSFNGDESLVAYGANAFPPARRTSRVEGRGSTCQFPGSLVPPMMVPPLKKRGIMKLHVPALFCLVTDIRDDGLAPRGETPPVSESCAARIDDQLDVGSARGERFPLALQIPVERLPTLNDELAQQVAAVQRRVDAVRLVLISKLHALRKLRGSVLAVPRQPSLLNKAGLGLLDVVRRRGVEELNARCASDANRGLRPQQLLELGYRLLEPAGLALELGAVAGWDRADVSARPHGGVVGRVGDGRSRDRGWPFTRDEHDSGLGGGAGEEGLDLEGGRETDDSGAGAW